MKITITELGGDSISLQLDPDNSYDRALLNRLRLKLPNGAQKQPISVGPLWPALDVAETKAGHLIARLFFCIEQ